MMTQDDSLSEKEVLVVTSILSIHTLSVHSERHARSL